MRNFLGIILLLISSIALADAPVIWSGTTAKWLPSGLHSAGMCIMSAGGVQTSGPVNLASGTYVTGVLANGNTTATSSAGNSTIVARDGSGNFSAGTITANLTGTASNVTTNANLTGPITSVGNATSVASQTGTGSTFVMNTSPTLVTPVLGVASATSIAAANGSTATPSFYTATGSGNTGFFFGGSGATFSYNGGDIFSFVGTQFKSNVAVNLFVGSSANSPALYLLGENNSGLYRVGANNLGFSISSTKILDIKSTGLGVTGGLNVSGLTASTALATDASKNLVSSATTDVELGYVNGVTSAIQTQLNGKQASGNYLTYTPNQYGVLLSGSAYTASVLAPDASTAKALISGGASANPSWGVLGVAGGGTGLATLTSHALYAGNGASAPTALSVGANNTVLRGSTGADPAFGSLVGADLPNPSSSTLGGVESIASVSHNFLTSISTSGVPAQAQPAFTDISGTATVAQGGTGQTSYTDGQLLIGNTSGNTLTKATLTQGTGITITNGNGSITIAASGGGGGMSSTETAAYTPAIGADFGTPSAVQFTWWRAGDRMLSQGCFTTGTLSNVTGGGIQIANSQSIDTTKIGFNGTSSGATNCPVVGHWCQEHSSGYCGNVLACVTTSATVVYLSNQYGGNPLEGSNFSTIGFSANKTCMDYNVPISGWTNTN